VQEPDPRGEVPAADSGVREAGSYLALLDALPLRVAELTERFGCAMERPAPMADAAAFLSMVGRQNDAN